MTKTPEEFKQELADADLTVVDWAKQHGFSRDVCYSVLSGRSQYKRGVARKCARAMGLLATPTTKKRTASKGNSRAMTGVTHGVEAKP